MRKSYQVRHFRSSKIVKKLILLKIDYPGKRQLKEVS